MSKDATRPPKRPRMSDADADSYVHDATLWLKDGNIILVSPKPEAKGFRVHRSILAMHSEVFADTFRLARPKEFASNEDRAQAEDCTRLPLEDDSYDVSCFLQYIYLPNYFHAGMPTSFIQLEAMLRMATKYLCQRLREDVVKQLTLIYCPTFPSESPMLPLVPALVPPEDIGTHAIAAIRMARLYNIPQILPVAFYYAATIDPVKYIDIHPGLSPEDQRTLISGRAKLMTATFEIAWNWILRGGVSKDCLNSCINWRYGGVRATAQRGPMAVDLFLRDMPHKEASLSKDVCTTCLTRWKEAECWGYSSVWNKVPAFFGLPAWPKKK